MNIDLEPDIGGVLIEGTKAELDGLRETLTDAIHGEMGEAEGALLTDDGVETVTIRRLPGEDEDG